METLTLLRLEYFVRLFNRNRNRQTSESSNMPSFFPSIEETHPTEAFQDPPVPFTSPPVYGASFAESSVSTSNIVPPTLAWGAFREPEAVEPEPTEKSVTVGVQLYPALNRRLLAYMQSTSPKTSTKKSTLLLALDAFLTARGF